MLQSIVSNGSELTYEDLHITSQNLKYNGYYKLYLKCKPLQPLERIFYLKYLQETNNTFSPVIDALLIDITNKNITFE